MNTTYQEFDTDSTSAQSSRPVRITRNSSLGFTLIELLVVISIIALLSTIVLGALSESRAKARNAAKNSLVLEYMKALELYRSDNNGSYPVTTTTPICFGYGSSEQCYANLRFGSDTIKTAMRNYLAGDFAHRLSVQTAGGDFKGITYLCNGSGTCNSYTLLWVLEGTLSGCPAKATAGLVSGNRSCTVTPS
jgi:prepilin-type N-terminal cleavage/methylation domain-containing protein